MQLLRLLSTFGRYTCAFCTMVITRLINLIHRLTNTFVASPDLPIPLANAIGIKIYFLRLPATPYYSKALLTGRAF